jgi:tRNA threonylcarbamoyl adenosine modification protein YeaZ
MKVLAIDTSDVYLNLALFDSDNGQEFIYDNSKEKPKSHSINLLPSIQQLLEKAVWSFSDIQKVVVTKGPGSFTGLRIGATVAKVMASQLSIDFAGVSTLETMYKSHAKKDDKLYIPIIDARNQNVFAGGYQNGTQVFEDGHFPINYLVEKYPQAIYILPDKTNSVFDLKSKIVVADNRIVNPVVLAKIGIESQNSEPDSFVPSYLRRTQAEMNWLENHQEGDDNVFITE